MESRSGIKLTSEIKKLMKIKLIIKRLFNHILCVKLVVSTITHIALTKKYSNIFCWPQGKITVANIIMHCVRKQS